MFLKLLFWFCLAADSVWRNCTCSEGYVREVWWWFSCSFCNKILYFCTLPSRFSFTILPKVAGNKIARHILLGCWKCVEVHFVHPHILWDLSHLYSSLSIYFFCGFQIILYFSCGLGGLYSFWDIFHKFDQTLVHLGIVLQTFLWHDNFSQRIKFDVIMHAEVSLSWC